MSTHEKTRSRWARSTIFRILALAVTFQAFVCLTAAGGARASLLSEVPEALSDSLGLDSTYIAGMLLSLLVMVSITLALGVAKAPIQGTIITELVALGALTVIGWLDTFVIVLVGLLVAALFAKSIISKSGPAGGADDN